MYMLYTLNYILNSKETQEENRNINFHCLLKRILLTTWEGISSRDNVIRKSKNILKDFPLMPSNGRFNVNIMKDININTTSLVFSTSTVFFATGETYIKNKSILDFSLTLLNQHFKHQYRVIQGRSA